jgi:hypothetical protein
MMLVLMELGGTIAEDFPDGLPDLKLRRDSEGVTVGEPILSQFLNLRIAVA